MPKLLKVKVPFTPVRRFFHDAAVIVGKKRSRSHEYEAPPPHHTHSAICSPSTTPALTEPGTPQLSAPANEYCIALLSEVPVDDIVVVSALTAAPFCCHADLLTMNAPQLAAVARALNDALPPPLRIDAAASNQPGDIRAEIETMVGLRKPQSQPQLQVPQAPMTPISARSSPNAYREAYKGLPACTRGSLLSEEDDYDGDVSMDSPPTKRRRIMLKPPSRLMRTLTSHTPRSPPSFRGGLARSISDAEVRSTPPFVTRVRPRRVISREHPRMSTPVRGGQAQADCELTFGLEGLTVAGPGDSGSDSDRAMDLSP
ncbi:hypothetical protein BC834DRAFT_969467 [Gloeopeniophorella convolvens]|nr:hypothetical protein BC834DRAFT_969467 [Gloeopeniophorella convolvens]